jgi:WD40 repeat protein
MGPEQFSPDLRYVAFRRLETERKIEVWDTTTHSLCREFDAPLAIHPVAYFSGRNTVRIFDRDGRETESIRCVEWELSSSKEVRSWTIPIGSPLSFAGSTPASQSLSGNIASLFLAVTFSADGERCLISTPTGKSTVFNFRTGVSKVVDTELMVERFPQFSPDGRLLAGRELSEIKLRETTTFREVARLPTVMRMPQSVAFSPDGDRLAVGITGDEAIMLWNPQTHEPLLTLKGTGAQFVRTAFSPDGNQLGSRNTFLPGSDGDLHIWSAPTWAEIEAAEKLPTRPVPAAP